VQVSMVATRIGEKIGDTLAIEGTAGGSGAAEKWHGRGFLLGKRTRAQWLARVVSVWHDRGEAVMAGACERALQLKQASRARRQPTKDIGRAAVLVVVHVSGETWL
jgi:hypothetical protein